MISKLMQVAQPGRIKRAAVVIAVVVVGLIATGTPAHASNPYVGQDPYNGSAHCATNGSQWTSPSTAVYDGSTLIGYGYLRYSGGCNTNWSEFNYATSAYPNYTVGPSAWDYGTSGTDQYSPNLAADPVYSRTVDGSVKACAGAQFYHYPSGQWIKWVQFYCA